MHYRNRQVKHHLPLQQELSLSRKGHQAEVGFKEVEGTTGADVEAIEDTLDH